MTDFILKKQQGVYILYKGVSQCLCIHKQPQLRIEKFTNNPFQVPYACESNCQFFDIDNNKKEVTLKCGQNCIIPFEYETSIE
jgi:hypothetical protein